MHTAYGVSSVCADSKQITLLGSVLELQIGLVLVLVLGLESKVLVNITVAVLQNAQN